MALTEQDMLRVIAIAKANPENPEILKKSKEAAIAYRRQQEGAGQPLFPTAEKVRQERGRKIETLFTDRETHGLPAESLERINENFRENPDEKYALFNRKFFEAQGIDKKKVDALGDDLIASYSRKTWGEEVTDHRVFFDRMGEEIEFEKEFSRKAQQLALSGSPMHEADAALDFDYVEDPRYKGREKVRQEQFRNAYQNVKSQLAGLEPTARVFVDQLKNQMGVGEGAGMAALPDQWFLDTVMDIPKEKRDLFLSTVAARAGEGEAKTLFQAMAERMGRTATDIVRASNATARLTKLDQLARHVAVNGAVTGLPDEFGFSPDEYLTGYLASREAADKADKSKVPAIGSDEFKALSPEQQTELERIEEEREFVLLYKKVNDIATGAIDPAKGSNYYASGLIGVAGMLPNLGLMAMGPAGMAVNARGYISQRTLDHAAANPGVDTRDSIAIGTAQGIGETMLDVIPLKVLSGKTPLLAKWLKKPTLTRSGIIGRGAARLTGGTILEGATEFGQEVIVPSAIEELAQILKAELPEANWDARLAGFTSEESLSEVIPSIVMLSFLGVGVGSIRDYKGGWQLVGNRDLLIGAKLTEAEADAVVEAARREDAETAQDLLRKAFVRIDEKRDITGVMPEAARTALKNVQAEAEARIIAEEKGEVSGIIPKYGRNTEGQHYLRFQDGTTRTYGTAAEASQARWEYAEEKRIDELSEFRSAITMSERGALPGQEFDFEFENRKDDLQQAKARGEVSEAEVQSRINQADRLDGRTKTEQEVTQDPDPTDTDIENEYQKKWTAAELQATRLDDLAAAEQILGSSRIEYVGEVTRFVIRLKQGATPLTVFEEKIEGDAKVTLKKKGGRDWMLTRLRDYERFSGDVMLPESDADVTTKDLVEAWSHFGISYLTGKTRKSERGEGYEDAGRAGIQRMMANAKRAGLAVAGEGYTEFFRAVLKRAAKINKMRREGKLDVDMEREIARSLGITEQFEYEQKATEEGQKFKQEIDPDGALNEEGETSFSVMQSDPESLLPVMNRAEAERLFADGYSVYSFDELEEGIIRIESLDMMSGYTEFSYDPNRSAGGETSFSVMQSDEVEDSDIVPGDLSEDGPVEDLPLEGEPIPWSDTSYSVITNYLPEVFPDFDENIKADILAATDTVAAIHIDRMRVGDFEGVPLQGGFFFPAIVENLKKGVVWAFNAEGVARSVARRAKENGGYVKLVLMQEGNVVGNKTFATIWFTQLRKAIASKTITKTRALAELNLIREKFADHPDSKLRTGHVTKWKTVDEAFANIVEMPQMKRASTYFQKTVAVTKSEGEKIAYQSLLSKKKLTAIGFPDAAKIVEAIEEPSFKSLRKGTVVGIIKFDELDDSSPVLTGEQAGVPEHLSYKYVLHGKPVARMTKYKVIDETFPETKNQILTQQHSNFPVETSFSVITNADPEYLNLAMGVDGSRVTGQNSPINSDSSASGENIAPDSQADIEARDAAYFRAIKSKNWTTAQNLLMDAALSSPPAIPKNNKEAWDFGVKNQSLSETEAAYVTPSWVFDFGHETSEFYEAGRRGEEPEFIVGWRRGGIPERGRSINWAQNEGEAGVSLAYAHRRTDMELNEITMIGVSSRPKHFVSGWAFPKSRWGSDGEIVILGANEIKLIEKDASGNPVPLSKRFPSNDQSASEQSDASFSVITNAESRIAESFNPFLRNPEKRLKIVLEAQRRAAEKGRGFQEIIRLNRSGADIERERLTREADLMGEKLDTLSPSEIGALEAMGTLDDIGMRPILSDLLREKYYKTKSGKSVKYWRGSLMSKSAAERQGINTKGGEWDGIPEGLPPYVWGGSIMPDQAANQFGFETTDEFWTALSAEVASYQNLKADTKAAMTRIRDLEKEAKAESKAWADEQKRLRKTVGTDRATLIAAMRTLDAMISALPSEIRGKIGGMVRLAQFKGPGAMLDELERRANRLDVELERWLKKEATKEAKDFFATVKKKVKTEAGKKAQADALPEMVVVMKAAEEAFKSMSAEQGQARGAEISGLLLSGKVPDNDVAAMQMMAELIPLFSGWNGRTEQQVINGKDARVRVAEASSTAQKFAAIEAAKKYWTEGMLEYKRQAAETKERRDQMREGGMEDVAKANKLLTRDEQRGIEQTRKSLPKKFALNIMTFDGFFRWHLGDDSKLYQWLTDSERKAANTYDDAVRNITKAVDSWFTEKSGSRFKGEKLRERMAESKTKITPEVGEVRTMSQLEMITAKLIWRQEDGKRHMKGRRDENGNVVSTWSYGEDFMAQIDEAISNEALELMDFLSDAYDAEYEPLNKVYRKLFGIDLPKHLLYSPLTVKPMIKGDAGVDSITGFFSGGLSGIAGALKTRGSSIVEPDFKDALQTYVSHSMQMEHFKAFAELSREARAILGRVEFRDQIQRASGEEGVAVLDGLLEILDKGGIRSSHVYLEATRTLDKLTGRLSTMILFGKLQTVALNVTQLAAASSEMGVATYWKQFGKLWFTPTNWADALRTPYVQRRIDEMPPVVRQVLESNRKLAPSRLSDINDKLGYGISASDGFFTAASYAMVYDWKQGQGREMRMTGDLLETWSRNETERIMDRIAQPTRKGARSIFENTLGPEGRAFFNFFSEARKNVALVSYAAQKDRSKLAGVAQFVFLNAAISSVIRAAWADLRDDDEEMDELYWNPGKIALEIAIDPLYGIPVVGGMLQDAIKSAFGFKVFGGSIFESGQSAIPATRRALTLDYDADEIDRIVADLNAILGAFGYFSRDAAALTAITNVIEDALKVYDNLTQ